MQPRRAGFTGSAYTAAMSSAGDSFAWPFQDPGWFGKMVLQGLIFIIPIVGWIAMYGWLMMTIDNYRAGRHELPPAGFHLERGLAIFLVYVVYGIVFSLPGEVIAGVGYRGNSAGLSALGNFIDVALGLFLAYLLPAVYLQTYRRGFAGGFDVEGVWQMASSNPSTTVIAGLLIIVAGIVSSLGVFVCCVGLLFTIPYGNTIIAGVVTWYEGALAGPAPAPTQPA